MASVKAGSKDLRALVRDMRPGFVVESDGKAKVRVVVASTGKPVRQLDGRPFGMANSPCAGSVKDARRRLRAVGVLKEGK